MLEWEGATEAVEEPAHGVAPAPAVHRGEPRHGSLCWLRAGGDGWSAVFSTRWGGVSVKPFDTLDLSLAVGDDETAVLRNRARLAAAAGYAGGRLVVPRQVHGTRLLVVVDEDAGRGALGLEDAPPETDALVTAVADLPLLITVADCVPVVLAARRPDGSAAVAAVHAGWRGLVAGVLREAANALAGLGRLTAAVVGPSIGPCCFRVGPDVASRFERFTSVTRGDRVDLWAAAAQDAQTAGVPPQGVAVAGLCTMCDARFFSHRGDGGRTGRQAAVAWVHDRRVEGMAAAPRSADRSARRSL